MKRPLIGIPPCIDSKERWRAGRVYVYADHAYAAAIDRAGGLPVHLPMQSDIVGLVDRVDGLLLPGGDDFAPEAPYPDDVEFDLAPTEQIAFDRASFEAAMRRRLPVLGICYGAQLIALTMGGALHHHLPHDRPDARDHRLPEPEGRHRVSLTPESTLHACLADSQGGCEVNSLHHQAVSRLGEGLRITARSEGDDVIEGFEADEGFVVGVQWHPEKLDDGRSDALFEAFVRACAGV